MDFFWVVFENSQIVLFSLKYKQEMSPSPELIDYLLKETRKHLDIQKERCFSGNTYRDIHDSLEYIVNKEKIKNTSSGERITILVLPIQSQQYKAQIISDPSLVVEDIKKHYVEYVTYNSIFAHDDAYGDLKSKINKEVVEPYMVMMSIK